MNVNWLYWAKAWVKVATVEMNGKTSVGFPGAKISPISLLEGFCPMYKGKVSVIFQPEAPDFQVVETVIYYLQQSSNEIHQLKTRP